MTTYTDGNVLLASVPLHYQPVAAASAHIAIRLTEAGSMWKGESHFGGSYLDGPHRFSAIPAFVVTDPDATAVVVAGGRIVPVWSVHQPSEG